MDQKLQSKVSDTGGGALEFERFSALFIRLTGISFTLSGLMYLSYLPRYLFDAMNARPGSASRQLFEGKVKMTIVRSLIYVVLGTILFVSWRRVAQLLTKDCEDEFVVRPPTKGELD